MKTSGFFYFLTLALACNNLLAQTAASYRAAVNSESPNVYFTLDNTLVDSVGGSLTLNGFSHGVTTNFWGNSLSAASFRNSQASDILTNANDLFAGGGGTAGNPTASGTGSMTFLLRTLSGAGTSQHWVFNQSLTFGANNQFSLFFESGTAGSDPGALKLTVGDVTNTILSLGSIVLTSWYYFGVTYDESRDGGEVQWYLGRPGGALNSGTLDMGNASVVGDNAPVTFGNRGTGFTAGFRNPGDGAIDEIAIWNRELSSSEITSQFNAITVPEPSVGAVFVLGLAFALRKRIQQKSESK